MIDPGPLWLAAFLVAPTGAHHTCTDRGYRPKVFVCPDGQLRGLLGGGALPAHILCGRTRGW